MSLKMNELMFSAPSQFLQHNNTKVYFLKFNQLQLICGPMLTFILEPCDIFYLFCLLSAPLRSHYIHTQFPIVKSTFIIVTYHFLPCFTSFCCILRKKHRYGCLFVESNPNAKRKEPVQLPSSFPGAKKERIWRITASLPPYTHDSLQNWREIQAYFPLVL